MQQYERLLFEVGDERATRRDAGRVEATHGATVTGLTWRTGTQVGVGDSRSQGPNSDSANLLCVYSHSYKLIHCASINFNFLDLSYILRMRYPRHGRKSEGYF